MEIKEIMEMAHDNAVKHGFYKCPECGGSGLLKGITEKEITDYPIPDMLECPICHGEGSTAKMNVIDALISEHDELYLSKPSKEFHKDSEQSELADIIFVCLAYAQEQGYDMDKAIKEKLSYNKIRVYDYI